MELYGHFMTNYGIMPDKIDDQDMELFFDVNEGLERKKREEENGKIMYVDDIEP